MCARRMSHNVSAIEVRSPADGVLRTGSPDIRWTGPKREAPTDAPPGRASTTVGSRFVDEFELIERCFRARATRHLGTVLGIGDDAALLDTAGRPLVNARATMSLSGSVDAGAAARQVFGAALIRLAARAVTPRWATLGITLEAAHPDWMESFSAAAAATSDACGVELIGGDTTRGPGRATVFTLGTKAALPRRTAPRSSPAVFEARLSLPASVAPAQAIADLVSVCTDLASHGADIRCVTGPDRGDTAGADTLEIVAQCDAAGVEALRAIAGRLRLETRRLASDA